MGGAADGDDVGGAVGVEVSASKVLGGDVGVEDGAVPGFAVVVVNRNAVVLASVAGEDFVVAVTVDVGGPEGVAGVEGVVEDGADLLRIVADVVTGDVEGFAR